MAYTDKEIYDESLELIKSNHNICFLSDLFTVSSFDKGTFYNHIKKDLNEFNDIKKALTANKNKTKQLLRQKWFESKQPMLQLALYKLLSNEKEFDILTSQKIEQKGGVKIEGITFNE